MGLFGPLESSEPKLLFQRPSSKSDFTWKSTEKKISVFLFCLNTENAYVGQLRGSIVAPKQIYSKILFFFWQEPFNGRLISLSWKKINGRVFFYDFLKVGPKFGEIWSILANFENFLKFFLLVTNIFGRLKIDINATFSYLQLFGQQGQKTNLGLSGGLKHKIDDF